jgi:outer membrane protein OmpA-like peptidoglycan-associated protein
VIEAELAGTLYAAVGLGDAWTGFVAVPFVLVLDGERVPGLPEGDGASLGDPEVGARVSLAGNKPRGAHLAAQLGVQFPVASALSERQSFVGSDGFTFSPQLIGDVVTDSLIWSLSVGARLVTEKARLLELDVGHEATAVLGAALPIGDSLSAHAEVFGSTFVDDAFSRSGTAIEGLAGLRVMPMQGFRLGAAVGSGFTRGVGAPDVRAVFSATLFSENRPAAVPPPPSAPQDSDLDGFIDVIDRCPSAAEDLDGFEDADGCPESDNDADGILDAADGCPLVVEDKDGFEDNDGCAETDNDGDGIADADDKCPTVAGKVELAGCPIVDADLDGVADAEDSCPNEPGTPELKGCKSKPLVQISGAKIELVERVYFETNKDVILPQSFTLLENVASVIKSHPEITTILVEGHTDDKGADDKNLALSQKRAEAVMQFLINHGVEKTRLQAKGFGEQVPIADNQTSEGRATNRRVEFRILSAVK